MLSWDDWKQKNKDKLKHPQGYEEQFVDFVLSKIPELTPNDVTPQYHFLDSKKGNRYIDFMIINSSKGWYLPIELDGKWKTESYYDFNDMLERQNALINKFGILLRYSNKKMHNDSASIVREVKETLVNLSNRVTNDRIARDNAESYLADLRASTTAHANNAKEIEKMREDFDRLLTELQKRPPVIPSPNPANKHMMYAVSLAVIGVFGLGLAVSGNKQPASVVIAEPVPLTQAPNPVVSRTVSLETLPEVNTKVTVVKNSFAGRVEPEVKYVEAPPVQEPEPEVQNQTQYVIGSHQQVCGEVAQYKTFAKGVYLNLGRTYPNQDITIVVWNATSKDVYSFVHASVCTSGVIKEYKGKPTVEVETVQAVLVQ